MPALTIRRDRGPVMLRKLAKRDEDVRAARRPLLWVSKSRGRQRR